MPGLDQTGPEGRGALTGRRLGRCTNYGAGSGKQESFQTSVDPNIPAVWGRGRGCGRGRGRRAGTGRGYGRGRGTGFMNRNTGE